MSRRFTPPPITYDEQESLASSTKKLVGGFTLIELVLSLALIGILTSLSFPIYEGMVAKNDLSVFLYASLQSARRAQVLSQAQSGDATWGVHVQTGKVILFRGANFTSRDTSYDEETAVSTNVTPSGLTDIVFAKLTGTPLSTGFLTLTTPRNETRSVTINSKGMLTY